MLESNESGADLERGNRNNYKSIAFLGKSDIKLSVVNVGIFEDIGVLFPAESRYDFS